MKNLFLTTVLLLAVATAWAVPARRITRTVTQPDGTQIELTVIGDEWMHYHADKHGNVMAFDEATRYWNVTDASEAIAAANATRVASNERRARRARTLGQRPLGANVGKKKALVILAEFQDIKFTTDNAQDAFNDIFNMKGYDKNGMGGSVRDYFLAQSYGQLDIDFDVVGPVTLPNNMLYYGENRNGHDIRPATFATHAINAADEQAGTDFSLYDWDGDGEVEQVFIIFAGYGEASNPEKLADCIWPHEWAIGDAWFTESGMKALHLDGVKINTYACSNELHGWNSEQIDGIGTACHEFSHCLGLPDMYDTSGAAFGMDQWDLMDYGVYNSRGYVPAAYTAYERWFAGWIEPTVLNEPCDIRGMKDINIDGECYIVYNSGNENEYYIMQNIQQTGWNAGAPACGMLIMHVDYSPTAWKENKVNSIANHQRMSPVCADNSWDWHDNDGDLWPWNGNDAFTDESVPAATLFNASAENTLTLSRPITDIKHENGLISFSFCGGSQPYTLTATGDYQTLSLSFNAIVPSEVKVFSANLDDSKTWAELTEESIVVLPKNTGVVVKAEEGEYIFEPTATAPDALKGNNILRPTGPEGKEIGNEPVFILAKKDGGESKFYRFSNGTLYANKAYFELNSEVQPQFIRIKDVNAGVKVPVCTTTKYFDLLGRPVTNNCRGLLIEAGENGKRVIIKK